MSGLKKPLSFDEQIDALKRHGMIIENEKKAKRILSEINYYRFTGYALQFRNAQNQNGYVEGTSFDRVYRIYIFEEELRVILKKYLDMVEIFARTQIAYGFSVTHCQASPYNQHYDSGYFRDKENHGEFCSSLTRGKRYNDDSLFVKHHDAQYKGMMPLWVIVELLSFSSLSKLYANMLDDTQNFIAHNMGSDSRNTHKNNLHALANLRNKVAHSARIYNKVI